MLGTKRLFLRRKHKLMVDLGELMGEGESLSRFLSSKLNTDVSPMDNLLFAYSDSLLASELKKTREQVCLSSSSESRLLVKLESNEVKIHRFKRTKKKKQKNGFSPSTVKHGW